MTKKLLSFELSDQEMLEIHVNREGAVELMNELNRIFSINNGNNDGHLLSDEWGGSSINSIPNGDKNSPIHSVKIMFWDQ